MSEFLTPGFTACYGVYPTTAPGLGANMTEAFLRKYKFDAAKTDEMERRTFNTLK